MELKPADYWQKIRAKTFQEVPYKPNPLKYAYLLQNDYPTVSNLQKSAAQQPVASRTATPAVNDTTNATPVETTQGNEGNAATPEKPTDRDASPAPNFGGTEV